MRPLRAISDRMLRSTDAKSWLVWIAIAIAYFFVGIYLGSDVFEHQIVAGLLAVLIGLFIVWVCYRYLKK